LKIYRNTALTSVIFAAAIALTSVSQAQSAQCGSASWYALTSKTASGERMDASKLTAAHRSLPFGSKIKVTNNRNGRTIVVRVNDRGPFVKGRIVDLSKAAASRLGFIRSGHTKVCLNVIG
jgi:peptidoglycan lytic transglycosylase